MLPVCKADSHRVLSAHRRDVDAVVGAVKVRRQFY